jgi:Protein of unknown function (DUF2934)
MGMLMAFLRTEGSKHMAQDVTRSTEVVEESSDKQEARLFREQIAALAYSLWQDRGCPQGTSEQDWFKAEEELTAKR